MKTTIKLCVAFSAMSLAGCGSDMIDLSCDKPELYQQAVDGGKIQVPDDLDNLDPSKAMPIPEASAPKSRQPGEPCLDIPPRYLEEDGTPIGATSEQ